MNSFLYQGDRIPFTNSATAAIVSGALVIIRSGTAGACGVAVSDIAGGGGTGVLATEGVYRLTKAAGAIARGALVYRNASTGAITTTTTGNTLVGYAIAAATTAATTVDVKIG
jgi:predicted RecA/RadA family phage recombinase